MDLYGGTAAIPDGEGFAGSSWESQQRSMAVKQQQPAAFQVSPLPHRRVTGLPLPAKGSAMCTSYDRA